MPKHSDSIADMQARVAARVEAEKETLPASKKQAPVLSDDFILKCLKANRIGDAMIFNALHREKFVYVKRWGRFLRWAGHHWQEDIMETALAAVEDVCSAYLRVAASLGKEAEGLAGDEKRMVESKREKLFQRVAIRFFGARILLMTLWPLQVMNSTRSPCCLPAGTGFLTCVQETFVPADRTITY
jgi:hypothetical protein